MRGKCGSHTYKLILSKSRRSLPPSSHSHEIGRRLTSSGDAILLMPFSPSSSSFSPAPLSPRDGASSQGTEIHQRVKNVFFSFLFRTWVKFMSYGIWSKNFCSALVNPSLGGPFSHLRSARLILSRSLSPFGLRPAKPRPTALTPIHRDRLRLFHPPLRRSGPERDREKRWRHFPAHGKEKRTKRRTLCCTVVQLVWETRCWMHHECRCRKKA